MKFCFMVAVSPVDGAEPEVRVSGRKAAQYANECRLQLHYCSSNVVRGWIFKALLWRYRDCRCVGWRRLTRINDR